MVYVQGYFQSLPGIHECPADQNPASYMLEIIGAGIGHVAQRDFGLDYQQSSLAQQNRMYTSFSAHILPRYITMILALGNFLTCIEIIR